MSTADAAEVPAMVPALLLCVVTLAMLVLDIVLPSMKDAQYIVYPALIKAAGLIGLVCAAACLRFDMYSGRIHPDVI